MKFVFLRTLSKDEQFARLEGKIIKFGMKHYKVMLITINRNYEESSTKTYVQECIKSVHILESFYQCIKRLLLWVRLVSPCSKGPE